MAEGHYSRPEVIALGLIHCNVAEFAERVQTPSHRGTRNTGSVADLGHRDVSPFFGESQQHRKTARQRHDEVAIVGCTHVAPDLRSRIACPGPLRFRARLAADVG